MDNDSETKPEYKLCHNCILFRPLLIAIYRVFYSENGAPTLPKPKVLTQCQISATEVQAIRQLIAGYRESAAFLYRSADELEALLPPL